MDLTDDPDVPEPAARFSPEDAQRRDRIAGGLVGLLVGDALGVPYEFHPAAELPPFADIAFDPPPGFRRAHAGVPPGTWSDDGAQALCLLASLLECGGFDLGDFSRRLVNWYDDGYLAVDGRVFDVGLQTLQALNALRSGAAPTAASPADERRNGNGSLMRVLPLALWHDADDAALMQMAAWQSVPTHAHVRAQIACGFYCLWARAELSGHMDAWTAAEESLRRHADPSIFPVLEIDIVLDPRRAQQVGGSGYVVDTLWSARHALDRETNYADTVRAAIALGNDTDTTAAVAGGIAGLRYGLAGIPPMWRDGLRGRRLLDPLLDALLARVVPGLPAAAARG